MPTGLHASVCSGEPNGTLVDDGQTVVETCRLRGVFARLRGPRHRRRILALATASLPVIWDADFLYGPKNDSGKDTYVLCEINVTPTFAFPEFAMPTVARATLERVRDRTDSRAPGDSA